MCALNSPFHSVEQQFYLDRVIKIVADLGMENLELVFRHEGFTSRLYK